MVTKPKRRWYQFSLRTMLIVMVVSSAAFGWWVHWSKEWIKQRQEWRVLHPARGTEPRPPFAKSIPGPCGLWIFGETGVSSFVCMQREMPELSRLFPEAQLIEYDEDQLKLNFPWEFDSQQ